MNGASSRLPTEARSPAQTRSPAEAGLRADARQNRDRIVDVARELFAERGLDVPMAAIARHARVGVATLYRRFPTKESLVTEVFAAQFQACVSVIDDALADPDPWHGFCAAIEKVCAMQAADRGFGAAFIAAFPHAVDVDAERSRAMAGKVCAMQAADRGFGAAFIAAFPHAVDVDAERSRAMAGFAELTRRAKATGRLRADFALEDLPLLLMANCGVVAAAAGVAPRASRRFVAYLLAAFHTEQAAPLPPAAPLRLSDLRSRT
ncbi:TetR/AcrR family transcriptional regulator [Solwaraspora sp. WMMB335]|uniref:TetR/AcrR family transcriptional regulator n=1 Tax=Solwaraspora sp. WMMB335 TaxID=3404118 RepID=UPI003B93B2A7